MNASMVDGEEGVRECRLRKGRGDRLCGRVQEVPSGGSAGGCTVAEPVRRVETVELALGPTIVKADIAVAGRPRWRRVRRRRGRRGLVGRHHSRDAILPGLRRGVAFRNNDDDRAHAHFDVAHVDRAAVPIRQRHAVT
eukprot:6209402-Pleurochrysis_carterae.AAC.6